MSDSKLTSIDIMVLVLLIMSIGAYFGALFSDNNWRTDLTKFSIEKINFRYDDSGKYYTIESHNMKENYTEINFSNVFITESDYQRGFNDSKKGYEAYISRHTISTNSEEYYQIKRLQNSISRNLFNYSIYGDLNESQQYIVNSKINNLSLKIELNFSKIYP